MCSIKLSRSFTNPQHVSRMTIIFAMMLPCQSCLIWQNQSFMRDKHVAHMLKKIIMCGDSVKVPITELAMLRLAVLQIKIINIVSLVIVNLFAIVYHELRSSRFGILACDSSDYYCLFRAGWLDDGFALVEKFHLILKINI